MRVFAHRGVHDRKVSENTLEAFKAAVQCGVDGIEFDLRLSRDGEMVAIHDENLDRVAGDARRVRDLTADELQSLVLRGHGSIPTLNDITSTIVSPTMLDIEVKDPEAVEPLIAKLKTSAALRERVIVSSFQDEILVKMRESIPDLRILVLVSAWPLLFRRKTMLARLTELNPWGVGFPANVLNRARIAMLRRRGWKVAAWDLQPLRREAKRVGRLQPDIGIVFKVGALEKHL